MSLSFMLLDDSDDDTLTPYFSECSETNWSKLCECFVAVEMRGRRQKGFINSGVPVSSVMNSDDGILMDAPWLKAQGECTVIWWHTTHSPSPLWYKQRRQHDLESEIWCQATLLWLYLLGHWTPLSDTAQHGPYFTVVPADSPTKTRLPCWEVLWKQMVEDQPCQKIPAEADA